MNEYRSIITTILKGLNSWTLAAVMLMVAALCTLSIAFTPEYYPSLVKVTVVAFDMTTTFVVVNCFYRGIKRSD